MILNSWLHSSGTTGCFTITVKSKTRRIRLLFHLIILISNMIFSVISRLNFTGHFDILMLYPLQNFLLAALEACAGKCPAGPCTIPGAPHHHWLASQVAWQELPRLLVLGVAMEEVWKSRPSTLTELKAMVEAFAESVDPEEVRRSARST